MMETKQYKENKLSKIATCFFSIVGVACFCAFVLLISMFIKVDTPENQLNMEYYTLINSSYKTISSSEDVSTPSTDFIGSHSIKRQYRTATVKLSSEWLYLFNIEKFQFKIETNADVDLQFDITLTNLKNGELDGVLNVKSKTFTMVCEQKAGKARVHSMQVDDTFEMLAKDTQIIFTLTNYEIYNTNGELNNIKFSISDVCLFGEHKI